jgi:hypothetical protein
VHGDTAAALAGAEAGLALLPGEGNLLLSYIGALVGAGNIDRARTEVHDLVRREPGWDGVLRAAIDRGFVPLPEGVTVDQLFRADP